jgi:hypothetical protein
MLWTSRFASTFLSFWPAVLYDSIMSIAAPSSKATAAVSLGMFCGLFTASGIFTLVYAPFMREGDNCLTLDPYNFPIVYQFFYLGVNAFLYLMTVASYFFAANYEERREFTNYLSENVQHHFYE